MYFASIGQAIAPVRLSPIVFLSVPNELTLEVAAGMVLFGLRMLNILVHFHSLSVFMRYT